MFQDYKTKVIKVPTSYASNVSLKTTTIQAGYNNALQGYVAGGVHGVARQVVFDTTIDNIVMSFDGSIVSPSGHDFVAFVHTYAADVSFEGDIDVPLTQTSLIPFFNIEGSGYFQGNVVIPKLDLEPGERQYIMVGICSPTAKASPVSMYIDMKLHLQDFHVFQPSK